MAIRKSHKLTQPAVLKQILKRCSSLGKKHGYDDEDGPPDDEDGPPVDVPKGHFAVYVGENRSRYIVPISFLTHPQFQCFDKLKKSSALITIWASLFLVKKSFFAL